MHKTVRLFRVLAKGANPDGIAAPHRIYVPIVQDDDIHADRAVGILGNCGLMGDAVNAQVLVPKTRR